MLEVLAVFAKYVPLGQTLLWVGLTASVLLVLRPQITAMASAVATRMHRVDAIDTPWLKLTWAPTAIQQGQHVGVTAEGVGGLNRDSTLENLLAAKQYPAGIVEDVYLVHSAAVMRPRTDRQRGLYRLRVWVEAYQPGRLDDVVRASYRLYNNEFPKKVVATEARQSAFELWLNAYGEFTIVCCVEMRDGTQVWMTRYLDLPGRPPD